MLFFCKILAAYQAGKGDQYENDDGARRRIGAQGFVTEQVGLARRGVRDERGERRERQQNCQNQQCSITLFTFFYFDSLFLFSIFSVAVALARIIFPAV